jgi:hypothetical protein
MEERWTGAKLRPRETVRSDGREQKNQSIPAKKERIRFSEIVLGCFQERYCKREQIRR